MCGMAPSAPTPLPGGRPAAEGDDPGQHEHLAGSADGGDPGAQPERVPQADPQRAEAVPAAHVRAHRVVDLLALAAPQPGHDEAGPVTEGVVELLLGHDAAGSSAPPAFSMREGDHGTARRPGSARARAVRSRANAQVVAPHEQRAEQGEGDQQHADAGEVGEAEPDPAQHQRDPGGDERPAAGGEEVAEPAHGAASAAGGRDRHPPHEVAAAPRRCCVARELGLAGGDDPVGQHRRRRWPGRRRAGRGRGRRARRGPGRPAAGAGSPGARRPGAGRSSSAWPLTGRRRTA